MKEELEKLADEKRSRLILFPISKRYECYIPCEVEIDVISGVDYWTDIIGIKQDVRYKVNSDNIKIDKKPVAGERVKGLLHAHVLGKEQDKLLVQYKIIGYPLTKSILIRQEEVQKI